MSKEDTKGTSLATKVIAAFVLVIAAWLLIKFVLGFITSIFASLLTAAVFVALIVAVIWALRRL